MVETTTPSRVKVFEGENLKMGSNYRIRYAGAPANGIDDSYLDI